MHEKNKIMDMKSKEIKSVCVLPCFVRCARILHFSFNFPCASSMFRIHLLHESNKIMEMETREIKSVCDSLLCYVCVDFTVLIYP